MPVTASINNPPGEDEKEPPGNPVIVGIGLTPDLQNVDDEYVKEASSIGVIEIVTVMAFPGHPLANGVIVYTAVPAVDPVNVNA
jgi:hypothetical protein